MHLKILVVDDDPLYIELVHDIVAQFGHEIIAAENGERALEHLRAGEVHLIISDIEMPVMGGIAFYGRVRELARHKGTPFVFLSGTTRADLLQAVRNLPDARLIQKAQLVAELPALMEELARGG
jgi:CheY-like chemotaxis protein